MLIICLMCFLRCMDNTLRCTPRQEAQGKGSQEKRSSRVVEFLSAILFPISIIIPFALATHYRISSTLFKTEVQWILLPTIACLVIVGLKRVYYMGNNADEDFDIVRSCSRIFLCLTSLVLGVGIHQKYNWPFIILNSLICLALGTTVSFDAILRVKTVGLLKDVGLLCLLGSYLMTDCELRGLVLRV